MRFLDKTPFAKNFLSAKSDLDLGVRSHSNTPSPTLIGNSCRATGIEKGG
jgi:hypothetical protein